MAEPYRSSSPWPWVAAVLGLVALVLAIVLITRPATMAPPDSDTTIVQPPPATTTPSEPAPQPGTGAPAPPATTPPQPQQAPPAPQPEGTEEPARLTNAVGVQMGEWFVRLTPSSVSQGPTAFTIRNVGGVNHGFEIEGEGVSQRSEVLSPNEQASVTVDLPPGTYTVYCYVGNHRERGMESRLQVQAAGSGPPAAPGGGSR